MDRYTNGLTTRLRMGHQKKLARAQKHLEALKSLSCAFKSNSVRLLREMDEDAGELVVLLEVDEFSDEWSFLLGECLYNMRASLDHLVWAIGRKTQGRAPASNLIAFPVCDHSEAWEKTGKRRVADLPEGAQNLILGMQPYQGFQPTASPQSADRQKERRWHLRRSLLWVVNHLNNVDKHRHIPVSAFAASRIKWQAPFRSYIPASFQGIGGIVTGRTEVLRVACDVEEHPEVKAEVTVEVSIQDPEVPGIRVCDFLQKAHDHFRDIIIPPLEPYL